MNSVIQEPNTILIICINILLRRYLKKKKQKKNIIHVIAQGKPLKYNDNKEGYQSKTWRMAARAWKQLPAAEEAPREWQVAATSEQGESGQKSSTVRGEYWMRDFRARGRVASWLAQLLEKDFWLRSVFLWRNTESSIFTETGSKHKARGRRG